MTAAEMWKDYTEANPRYLDEPYEAWSFGGDDPDALAKLVISGAKTATASAYPCYIHDREPLPYAGAHSVILSSGGDAVCIIRTARVHIAPFREVSERHARLEGEGDGSLEYWRSVHSHFFALDLEPCGLAFTEDMPVVCEEFERVWPK